MRGLDAARARGVRLGRPQHSPELIRHARHLLTHPGNSVTSIARLLGMSRSTIYQHVPELTHQQPAPCRPRGSPTGGGIAEPTACS